jgi:hypothetical protein
MAERDAMLVKAGFLLYFRAIRAPAHPPIKLSGRPRRHLRPAARQAGKD